MALRFQPMPSDLDVALDAARAGAAVVRHGFDNFTDLRMKGEVDPVTEVDEAAERAIFEVISEHHPNDAQLGEEGGGEGWDAERVWIVDPLDGTVNFIHGMGHVGVSVAMWDNKEPQVGCVIDVIRGEEFAASRGEGATLDGAPVFVSETSDMAQALVVTGFPYDRRRRADEYASTVAAVMKHTQGVRRLGSAALDLAWVACGRFDGYWEYNLGPWDVAAGLLLVEQAGGVVTHHSGERYRPGPGSIVSGNPHIQPRLREIVGDNLPAHLR